MDNEQLASDVMSLLRELSNLMRHRVFTRLEEFDVTPQMAWALHHLGDGIPMGALADRLSCDASYMTGIADGLEQRGLVERRPDPSDRRVKQLALTDEGRKVKDMVEGRLFEQPPLLRFLENDELDSLKAILLKMLVSSKVAS